MRNFVSIVGLLTIIFLSPLTAFSETDWRPYIEPADQIFPSLIIAMANLEVKNTLKINELGDANGLVGIEIKSPANNCLVKIVVTCRGLMEESTYEAELSNAGTTYTILPNIAWDYEALRNLKQPCPVNMVFDVLINGKSIGRKIKKVRVRSINDCPIFYKDSKRGKTYDMKWMFAAYVNEDHPMVDKILHEALTLGIVDSFTGYQGNDQKQVYLQVYSIWNIMQRKGLKYSSITQTSSHSDSVVSQHVRFINESVGNAQANCVDGSVLFASILRKIGIKPVLVLIPGHCFVGFYIDENKSKIACLETTMMGMVNLNRFVEKNLLSKLLGMKSKQDASMQTFIAAIEKGNSEFNNNLTKFADKDSAWGSIEIDSAREIGIMPIVSISGEAK